MEIHYSKLQIEITRLCNQICKFCCRGKAQNLNQTIDNIDALFDNNDIRYIDVLMFSGGEPTLNGKLVDYVADKVIQKEILVDQFIASINGLSYSEDLVHGLNKLKDYIIETSDYERLCPGILMITQDQFHAEPDPKVVEKLSSLSYFSPILKIEVPKEDILPYGYAFDNHLTDVPQNLSDLTDYQKNYEVVTENGKTYLYIEYQYISSNGNIDNDGCQSYDLLDKYALGNVKKDRIQDIYLSSEEKRLYLH